MKSLLSAFILLISTSSAIAAAPNVGCEVNYVREDAQGVPAYSVLHVRATVEGTSKEIEGFTVKAGLEQICAADGGPCQDAYRLNVNVSKNNSASSLSVIVPLKPLGWIRYSTSLSVYNESAFLNCDVDGERI